VFYSRYGIIYIDVVEKRCHFFGPPGRLSKTGWWFKPHSARTGRTVFSQLSAAVVRHKANDGVVYAIRAWFKYDAALSAVV